MDIVLVADYLLEDLVRGAQLTDQAMLHHLGLADIKQIRSKELSTIDTDTFYILSSFFHLRDSCKFALQTYGNYIIFEHDHGYIQSRNPFMVEVNGQWIDNPDGLVLESQQINILLYQKAKAVICLTQWHQDQLARNLKANLENIGGASWLTPSLDTIDEIREGTPKKWDNCFFNDDAVIKLPNGQSFNQGQNIKNKKGAMQYCIDNHLRYRFLPRINDNKKFMSVMAKFETFIFFPHIPETCSRILTEAKMLGLEVITNDNSGAYHEPWFTLNGKNLTNHFRDIVIPHSIEVFRKYLP